MGEGVQHPAALDVAEPLEALLFICGNFKCGQLDLAQQLC